MADGGLTIRPFGVTADGVTIGFYAAQTSRESLVFGGIVIREALADRVEELDQVIRTVGDRNGDI